MLDKLHSFKEGAGFLGLSPHTLRAWYQQGRIEGIKLGRRVLISEKELKRIVDEGKTIKK